MLRDRAARGGPKGRLSPVRANREVLRARITKLKRSALRLPSRLAHSAHVFLQIVYWTATFQLRTGLRRKRDARLIRNSGLFEPDFYLSQCGADARAHRDPVQHYILVGAARGLRPCPLFDASRCAERTLADGAAAENPLAHFIRARANAKRPPRAERRRVACADVASIRTACERDVLLGEAPGSRMGTLAPRPPRGAEPLAPEPRRAPTAAVAEHSRAARAITNGARRNVLAAGVYLCDVENRAVQIASELARAKAWNVEQQWIALGRSAAPETLAPLTVKRQRSRVAKFVLLNELLGSVDLDRYEYVLVCDDDISLPHEFLDRYLALAEWHDLALAQPARTHGSYTDNWIVERLDGLDARTTRFVEIGPLFSMRRDAARLLLPFDQTSPMGWGYDFVWPLVLERAGLRMGIVDATPVAHDMRKPVALYDNRDAAIAMRKYLSGRPHLSPHESFSILESYA